MIRIETKNKEQELLKAYLEANASETLIDKINKGVKIVKDSKTLINKKTLDTFMSYATEEARKQAEQGAKCAMVEDNVVFGWLIHYFQEDTIEGILYNEDGTEYKATVIKQEAKPKAEPKPKSNVGEVISMFEGIEDVLTPKNPLENLKSNIITFPSGDYLYIGYDNGIIYAGAMTNTGILRQYEFEYEHDLSVDKNIQDIYEYILEKEPKYASKTPVINVDIETGEVLEQYEFDIEIAAKLKKACDNIMKAIEMGVVTEMTASRLKELEAQLLKFDFLIEKEKQKTYASISIEDIENYLRRDIFNNREDMKVRKMIVNTFIREIVLFEDRIVITYNFKNNTDTGRHTPETVEKMLSEVDSAYTTEIGSSISLFSEP